MTKLTMTLEGDGGRVQTQVDIPLDGEYVKMIYQHMLQVFMARTVTYTAPKFGTVEPVGPIEPNMPEFMNPTAQVVVVSDPNVRLQQ